MLGAPRGHAISVVRAIFDLGHLVRARWSGRWIQCRSLAAADLFGDEVVVGLAQTFGTENGG